MRGHSLAIANHSTSHLAWHLTGWSPRQVTESNLSPSCFLILSVWLLHDVRSNDKTINDGIVLT
jgi:hypothetical protein